MRSAVFGAVVLAALAGCGGERDGSADAVRVLFTGETMGELEPCQCAGVMAGGLPVRGAYVGQQARPFLLLDVGCVGAGARRFEVLRTLAALRAMKAMGYDAANVGETELWLGGEGLRELAEVGVPLVSANVTTEDGSPAVTTHLFLDRGAVTGVADHEHDNVGAGLRLQPPREALARLLPALREKADTIIVLADLNEAQVRALAEEFPEITLILFRGRGDSLPPQRVNRTVIASIYGESRYIGDLTLSRDAALPEATGKAVLLEQTLGADERVIAAGINWYKDAVRGQTFDLGENKPGWDHLHRIEPEPGNGYVGSEACKSCHAHQYERWSGFAHAHAMESLQQAGYDWSPECVVCHVVGYGADEGYVSAAQTPQFANVGCESCHGPGRILLNGHCKGLARRGDVNTCLQCHDGKHHPDFDFALALKSIDHTEPKP